MPNPQNRNDRRKGEERSETLIIPHITKEMLETARRMAGLLFGFRLGRFCLCLPHLHLLAQGGAFFGRETGAAGGDDAVFTLRRGGHRLRGRGGMLGRAGCR